MHFLIRKIFALSVIATLIFPLTGCDLFSPKKTTKKPVVETTEIAPAAVNDNSALGPNVVARVGSWQLTTEEFDQRLKLLKQGLPDFNENDSQTKATVLNELIRQQLLVKDAESSDIVEQKDIKDAIEDFRRTLLVQELANRITKGVVSAEAEALKYYEQNKNIFIKWKVRQILVNDEATAKSLLVRVLQGEDFAAVAKEQSKDKTASEGGLIPDINKAIPEVQKATITLEVGATSSVIKGADGYYIVHVDEKKTEPFANVKKDLIDGLTLRKQQSAILEYIDKLAQKTKVDVNQELLGLEKK